ncbi:MAG: LapA family protein [Sphingomonadaceae bacterium]|nr:LapA family protein [Sphingomonadaceae bacterium]
MQVMRTIVWIVITAILVAFVAMNWGPAAVNFWPVEDGYLHFEWPVGVIAIIFFALGFFPMWLLNRAHVWRLRRRVGALENSLRAAAAAAPVAQDDVDAMDETEGELSDNVP